MVKAFWQQLPHTSAALGALLLLLLALRFPFDAETAALQRSTAERRKETVALVAFMITMFALRVVYAFHYRIDSDEPQHLHVVWGWTQGLLPYRDVFDNHMPLFHLLCVPVLATLGERADILPLMRLAMIPLYGITLWGTYRIGAALFSPRVGRWAAVFTGLLPGFFFCAVEFRTDDLWVALWVVALAILVEERLTLRRGFLVGLILGTTLCVSMKTVLLFAALSMASSGAVFLLLTPGERFPFREVARYGLTVITGMLLIPLGVISFFVIHGAGVPLWYGTIQHNVLPGMGHWHRPYPICVFPLVLVLLWRGAQHIARSTAETAIGRRRVLIFLATAGYAVGLFCFWPLWTREDYLPLYPPLVVFVTAVVLHFVDRASPLTDRLSRIPLPAVHMVPIVIGSIEVILLVLGGPLWWNKAEAHTTFLADVLRLTTPNDSVVDVKGETVFRPRMSYYVLEGITRSRIKQGLLPDDIPARLVAARTCVAVGDDYRFPAQTRAFLLDNFLPVGTLRVAGHLLSPTSPAHTTMPFLISIPARYAIVAEHGTVAGWLDGTPYTGARLLAPGRHEFRATVEDSQFAVLWAQAIERGFSPFAVHRGTSLQLTKHIND